MPENSNSIERARLLIQQSRFKLAEQELHQVLTNNFENSVAHSLLAVCYAEQSKHSDAIHEAKKAIQLTPYSAYSHFVLGLIFTSQNHLYKAKQAINEAIRLNPQKADYFAAIGDIGARQEQWADVLNAAEDGLKLDPEHISCINLKARALVNLDHQEAAKMTIDQALHLDPENATTQANCGWLLLKLKQHEEALNHFGEALRLNPQLPMAHLGIVEALKSRYLIYRWLVRYFSWLSQRNKITVQISVLGLYLSFCYLSILFLPTYPFSLFLFIALFFIIGFLPLLTQSLFDFILRLDPKGRLVLSKNQITASNWVGFCLVIVLTATFIWLLTMNNVALGIVIWWTLMLIPISAIFRVKTKRLKYVLIYCTILVTVAGFLILIGLMNPPEWLVISLVILVLIGAIGGIFALNWAVK